MRSALTTCLVLLAVLLPPKLWRASFGETLWLDETYSLVLTTHPIQDLVRLTADDAHPPLYYLGLKTWLRLVRGAGLEPGIFWARSLNLVLWALAAVAALLVGRRLFGRGAGTLFGWSIAAGAAGAQMALDARSYGFAFPGVVLCYLALIRLAADPEGRRPIEPARWWSLY
ncbi:MAG TPA: hypothetical protein VJG13_05020, partial [Thermoanaerobaculia bacterium]|nr:hypothetical protein [Thermoanaerobaculia bacterium]